MTMTGCDVDVNNDDSIGSLSNNVFERRTSTGSGLFSFFDGGFAQIFSQIASIIVKKLRNTNFISSRHVKRENTSLPVDVSRSKTSLLKLPITWNVRSENCIKRTVETLACVLLIQVSVKYRFFLKKIPKTGIQETFGAH